MTQKLLPLHRLLLALALAWLAPGCAHLLIQPEPSNPGFTSAAIRSPGVEPSIIVRTHQTEMVTFHDGWTLTFDGIAGTAEYSGENNNTIIADTTISYFDVTSAAPARGSSTMRQFMLTILGVILLIGLAAIILYAAFIATGR